MGTIADTVSLEQDLHESIEKVKMEIIEQREEILRAFVAKYGLEPEECVQVVDFSDYHKFTIRWRVERKKK